MNVTKFQLCCKHNEDCHKNGLIYTLMDFRQAKGSTWTCAYALGMYRNIQEINVIAWQWKRK